MKEYDTSNDNYKIKQPETQADFFSLEEDLVYAEKYQDDNGNIKTTSAPLRNVHIYGVTSHTEE